jgi:hypothetical protein
VTGTILQGLTTSDALGLLGLGWEWHLPFPCPNKTGTVVVVRNAAPMCLIKGGIASLSCGIGTPSVPVSAGALCLILAKFIGMVLGNSHLVICCNKAHWDRVLVTYNLAKAPHDFIGESHYRSIACHWDLRDLMTGHSEDTAWLADSDIKSMNI